MRVVYKEYVSRIKAIEEKKPPHERRIIPSTDDIISAANISRTGFSNYINNKTKSSNHDLVDTIIGQFRACGFDTNVGDLIAYVSD